MKTKTEQAVEAFKKGDLKAALRTAKTFKMGVSKAEATTLSRGYECLVWPTQYQQLGYDPEQVVRDAVIVFINRFVGPANQATIQ